MQIKIVLVSNKNQILLEIDQETFQRLLDTGATLGEIINVLKRKSNVI